MPLSFKLTLPLFQAIARSTLIALLFLSLGACSNLRFPGVYKIDIPQGNIVTQDILDQLKPGMQYHQVEYLLGPPLVQDTFNQNRWEYFYTLKSGRTNTTQQSHVSVFFNEAGYTHYVLEGKIKQSSIRKEATPHNEPRKKFLGIF